MRIPTTRGGKLIGFTKLIHGEGTVSEVLKYRETAPHLVPSMFIRFTETRRPVVFWNITNECNLSCVHCYISGGPAARRGDELSLEEAKAFIDDLVEMNVPLLMFTGGEPLVRKDFWELASYARLKGLKTALSTNGTLITTSIAKKIRDHGIEYAGISLDGANEKTHDTFRKQPGSFRKAVQGLKNCVRVGLKCGVRITATKHNYLEIPDLIDLTVRLKIPRFCLYWLVPSGRGVKLFARSNLEPGETLQTLNMLYDEAEKLGSEQIEILTVDAPQDGIFILNQLQKRNPARYNDALKLLELTGGICSAADRLANVDPTGNIYPCQFAQLPKLRVGNLRQGSFSEVWNDSGNPVLSMFRSKVENLKGKCGKCDYRKICGGGCRVRAYMRFRDFWAEDPFCSYNPQTGEFESNLPNSNQ